MTADLERKCRPSDTVAAEIGDRYGLGAPIKWHDLGGSWTTNLRLDYPDRRLVARIHQGSTREDRLAALQAARTVVADAGLPATPPLPTPDGCTMITLQSGYRAELENYLPWIQRMNTPPLLCRGFRTLGRLHDILRAADLPAAARSVRYANHVHAADAVALARRGVDRIRSWGDRELTGFADLVLPHIEAVTTAEGALAVDHRQLVHGDFWDNNIGFTDGQLTALLDFDFMAERNRIDDLALPIWFFLLEPGRGMPDDHDQRFVRDLTDAYDAGTDSPLTRDERRALPLAVARQPAWSVGRWVRELPEQAARDHARSASAEFKVAEAVRDQLEQWQQALLDE